MFQTYQRELVGPVPPFPHEIEDRIDQYLVRRAARAHLRKPCDEQTVLDAKVKTPVGGRSTGSGRTAGQARLPRRRPRHMEAPPLSPERRPAPAEDDPDAMGIAVIGELDGGSFTRRKNCCQLSVSDCSMSGPHDRLSGPLATRGAERVKP